MAVRNRQIGWSNKSNLLYQVLKEFNAVKGQFAVPTTTTTTTVAVDSMITIDTSSVPSHVFDIPFFNVGFGCWVNMANDAGFPRIFSFGQYPSASQAISIEGNALLFWYNGSPIIIYSLTSYIGNWVWIWLQGSITGGVDLYINGSIVASGIASVQATISSTLYIGSENAPSTYLNGLMGGFIFDVNNYDGRTPPTLPIIPTSNTVLLIGQGNDLTSQLTDQGIYKLNLTTSNISYSANSSYSPGNGGSLKFG